MSIPEQMGALFVASYFRSFPDPDADKRKPHAPPISAEVNTFPSEILLVTREYDSLRASGEKLKTEGDRNVDVRGRSTEGMIAKEGVPVCKDSVDMYDQAAKLIHDVSTN